MSLPLRFPKNWEESVRLLYSAPTVAKPWEAWELLDEIAKRANDPSDSSAGLSKLTSILPSTAWGYENKWPLSAFTPFLSIKSVRNFCVGSLSRLTMAILAVHTLFLSKKALEKIWR